MLRESHEVIRLMRAADHDAQELLNARSNHARAGAIGRMRLTLDALAEANIAERYALAADRAGVVSLDDKHSSDKGPRM